MTADEIQAHKEKVKKVMVDHLTELGYPDKMTNEQIMGELKPMWIKLEEAGLVIGDMNFQAYCHIANGQYTFQQIKEVMGI
jgi:hypothetical protein